MEINNVIKNVTPAVAVMVVGLVGAYFVYDNYFSARTATSVSIIEPAGGEEFGSTLESDIAPAAGEDAAMVAEPMPAAEGEGMGVPVEAAVDAVVEQVIPEGCMKMEDGSIVKIDDNTVLCEIPPVEAVVEGGEAGVVGGEAGAVEGGAPVVETPVEAAPPVE